MEKYKLKDQMTRKMAKRHEEGWRSRDRDNGILIHPHHES
jgi:hypothetical protein